MTCLYDLNYVNICMTIYLHVLYNYIGIGIMHSNALEHPRTIGVMHEVFY